MLLYREGRFYTKGVSFKLPDGFYLVTEPETTSEELLSMTDAKEEYSVIWQTVEECEGTKEELEEIIDPKEGYGYIGEIESIEHNGLRGHQLRYRSDSGEREYCERRYQLSDDIHFVVIIYTEKETGIEEVLSREEVKDILDSIRAEV